MAFRLGIDIGGTFTDFVLVDQSTGRTMIHKQLTTPADPSVSVLTGSKALLEGYGVSVEELELVVHGTTLVTNAVIERRGAVTGMLTTKGFRDVFEIALERRYDLYDLGLRFPSPLVPRNCRSEIAERIRSDGSVLSPLDLDEVRAAINDLLATRNIEALAVCFLHSHVNATHEKMVEDLVAKEFPQLYLSTSSNVFPYIREYERWTTTTINVYAQPIVDRYLENLENGLAAIGFGGPLYIMASNGGTMTPETARRFPVRMLESGPAAGALMSAFHGRALGISNLLSFDMGGTTAKGCLIRDGEPLKRYDIEVARIHDFKAGSGLPVRIPVIDMIEIGAGGGSIADIDRRGLIRVGPRSAGADPGPACYRKGGTLPTLTDANLSLGYLNPAFFLGGEMSLDDDASKLAIQSKVATPLDLDTAKAAWGIHEVINEDVARAFRIHASERGFDYRSCSMVAFGGSGPAHAARIARKLGIPKVVFPRGAGVMSALGLLVSPLSFEIVKSDVTLLDDLAADEFEKRFEVLIKEAKSFLQNAGLPEKDIKIERKLDMRYLGQGYEIEVALNPERSGEGNYRTRIPALFAAAYERVFSMAFLEEPIEIVNWKVEVRGPEPSFTIRHETPAGLKADGARKSARPAYFPECGGGYIDCAVYDRYALQPGDVLEGPALIEEKESTCVIGNGDRAIVDADLNLVATIFLRSDMQ